MTFYFQAFGFDVNKYPNVAKWYARVQKTIDGYKEINEKGARQLREKLKGLEK
jgi:capsid protein